MLGGIGLFLCVGVFLKSGYKQMLGGKELDTPRMIRSLSDLEASISNIRELSQSFIFLLGYKLT